MQNKYFTNDEYHTPEDKKRIVWDKLCLGSSFYFRLKFSQMVATNRTRALQKQYDTAAWASSSYQILELLEDCGGKFHIKGFEHVNSVKDEAIVFVSNHMGTLETMIFPGLIAPIKKVTFVVKESLIDNDVFGPIMRTSNPITVSRHDSRHDFMKVINEGKQNLSKGISIVIFPQSTRTLDFTPSKFNSLGIKLAQKAKVKVIPIAIKTDFWANGKFIKDLGYLQRKKPIHIEFGAPIEINGNGKEEHQKILAFIGNKIKKWNKEM